MAGGAAAAAARLPGAFPAARSGESRRAPRRPASGAESGPALWGYRGDEGRRAGLPSGAADGRRAMAPGSGALPAPLPRRAGAGPSFAAGRARRGAAPRSQGLRCLPRGCSLPGKCLCLLASRCPLSLGGKTKCPWRWEGEGAPASPCPPRLSLRGASGTPVRLCDAFWVRGEPRTSGKEAAGEGVLQREPRSATAPVTLVGSRAAERAPSPLLMQHRGGSAHPVPQCSTEDGGSRRWVPQCSS